MTSPKPPRYAALAVCGPTAVGKSDLAIELARRWEGGAEVLNLDSVQVYRELDIGSAKVPPAERGGVPHHLLDLFPPTHAGNVAQYRDAALSSLAELQERGVTGILVGGSGMYVTALLHGLAEVPATPPELREQVQALSTEEIYAALQREDPTTAARLHCRDRQRLSRALEVARLTGGSLAGSIDQHLFREPDVVALVVVVCRPRQELYARINARADQMVANGIIEETQGLLDRYGAVPVLKTLGYRQVCDFLAGQLSRESLAAEIALKTRQFAKRQMTYWRNEPAKRGWVTVPAQSLGEGQGESTEVERRPGRKKKEFQRDFITHRFASCEALYRAVRERWSRSLERTEVWYVEME